MRHHSYSVLENLDISISAPSWAHTFEPSTMLSALKLVCNTHHRLYFKTGRWMKKGTTQLQTILYLHSWTISTFLSFSFIFNFHSDTHMHLLIVFQHSFLCISHNDHVCTIFCIQRQSHLIWPGNVEALNPTNRAEEMPFKISFLQWIPLG